MSNTPATSAPIIILVRPQLGENIGKAARAMMNFGLEELRLVSPRDGWPNPDAGPAASRADPILEATIVFDTLAEAVTDCNHVYASTVRERDMPKPVVTPEAGARAQRSHIAAGHKCGILFGPEKAGLTNEDIVLADTIWTVPANPAFSSLNLAQAVMIAAYEWHRAGDDFTNQPWTGDPPATKQELQAFFDQLEGALDAKQHFRPPERKPVMVRSLRNIFQGAKLTQQQIRTLHGVVKSLVQGEIPKPRKKQRKQEKGDDA